jgi:hypothetical protein
VMMVVCYRVCFFKLRCQTELAKTKVIRENSKASIAEDGSIYNNSCDKIPEIGLKAANVSKRASR